MSQIDNSHQMSNTEMEAFQAKEAYLAHGVLAVGNSSRILGFQEIRQ